MDRLFYKIKSDYVFRMKHPSEQKHSRDFQVNIKDEHQEISEYLYAEKVGERYEEFLTRLPIVDLDNFDDGIGIYCEAMTNKKGYITFMEPEEMFEAVEQQELDKYFWEMDNRKLRIDAIKFAEFGRKAYDVKLEEEKEQEIEKTLIIRR